jgi:IS1 family transposase
LAQKKWDAAPALKDTLVKPDRQDPASKTLELDEVWSFVVKKTRKRWIWIALCRRTRQVVAYVIGDRSAATCRKLWDEIPRGYRSAHCYTDFWEAYNAVIPDDRHAAVGKQTGETAHVERWNNTLRQRLARFVRKSLSFSKSDRMHEICLGLFIRRYNLARAASCD